MTEWARDKLKLEVNTRASEIKHDFSTHQGMPCGPAAFLLFAHLRVLLMLCSETESGQSSLVRSPVSVVLVLTAVLAVLTVLALAPLASKCAQKEESTSAKVCFRPR